MAFPGKDVKEDCRVGAGLHSAFVFRRPINETFSAVAKGSLYGFLGFDHARSIRSFLSQNFLFMSQIFELFSPLMF